MAAVEFFSYSLHSDANLKAYYRLEADGTADTGTALSLVGGPSFVAAQFNNGPSLNGSTQALRNTISTVGNGNMTAWAWLKVASEPGSGVDQSLFALSDGTNFVSYSARYENVAGTKGLTFYRTKNGVADQNTTQYVVTLGTTTFHHIAMTYDSTSIRGYLDGALVGGPAAASGNGSASAVDGIILGARNSGGAGPGIAGGWINGILDDFVIFNRALSDTEISNYFNNVVAGGTVSTAGRDFMLMGAN